MVEDRKDVHTEQSGSGSHSRQPIQRTDQGDPAKKDEQGHEDQNRRPLAPKKDVQGQEQHDEESRKTGSR